MNHLNLYTSVIGSIFIEKTKQKKTHILQIEVLAEGDNYLGVRHAIETLLQLIVFDEISQSFLIPSGTYITDLPAYKHRGILLDTARSFYPVKTIKRTLDAMAYNKLNSFHWHITDSQSFAFASKTHPKMTDYGAYSSSQVRNSIIIYIYFNGTKICNIYRHIDLSVLIRVENLSREGTVFW